MSCGSINIVVHMRGGWTEIFIPLRVWRWRYTSCPEELSDFGLPSRALLGSGRLLSRRPYTRPLAKVEPFPSGFLGGSGDFFDIASCQVC